MRRRLATSAKLVPLVLLLSVGPVLGWEATRSGPILDKDGIDRVLARLATAPRQVGGRPRDTGYPSNRARHRSGRRPFEQVRIAAPVPPLTAAAAQGPASLMGRRTVEYPLQSGARLADGWDFITNSRIYSQCINYGTGVTDAFQQVTMDYTRAVDDETFSVALNINTSASVSGGIGNFSGKADGSFNIDTSYKLTSKDDVIVAHASVVNGATYVTAQTERSSGSAPPEKDADKAVSVVNTATKDTIAGVKLSPGALQLLTDGGREVFRAACGDGFVAAIGTGADLYLLYHFTQLDTDKRLKIVTSMKAGGGVTGVFNASGSMESTLQITDLVSKQNLGIYFMQSGGAIASLPVKLEDIGPRVAALPSEAFKNGKPLYVIVVPYNELYNWPLNFEPSELIDLRTSLVRYLRRIRTAFNELQVIIADFRDHRGSPDDTEYLHDNAHRLRAVDYPALNDELKTEIETVEDAIRTIDSNCSKGTVAKAASDCKNVIPPLQAKKIDTNDFRFLIRLPVPKNVVDPKLVKQLQARDGDIDDRKFVLSMQLYRHWVERLAVERCALFSECQTQATRTDAYNKIKSSLKM